MDEELLKKKLFTERPSFHGRTSAIRNWKLADDVLHWLDKNVRRNQRTLETGCGYSTIIFALKGTRHTVISPIFEEHQRIREWCDANEIDLPNVEFKLARSEDLLPALKPEPLDLVLIDGWHALPAPFLDWFFTAKRLVKPHSQLPRHLQLMQRLTAIAAVLMGRFIAGFTQAVQQLGYLCVDDLAVPELVD